MTPYAQTEGPTGLSVLGQQQRASAPSSFTSLGEFFSFIVDQGDGGMGWVMPEGSHDK